MILTRLTVVIILCIVAVFTYFESLCCTCACMLCCSVGSNSLQPYGPWPTRLLCPWDSPGKNIGVGCYFLLQGIFLTQGSNPGLLCLLHRQADSNTVPPGKSYYVVHLKLM